MEPSISRGLTDKFYEKRKAAALEIEKLVRECYAQNDTNRIHQIIEQLVDLFSTPSNALHARNGGLIGLAATAIALGVEISPFMEKFIDPLLKCFSDSESRIRYFACESMYNIAKVSKGEILVYFNQVFDALSKLAADSELSVKNGAELLDRLLKDIVAESAPVYFPQYPETERIRNETHDHSVYGLDIMVPVEDNFDSEKPLPKKAFSLAHFIPLLSERIYVINPFTRSYLVSWITVLDSVPDLELVSFLPEFLDGLFKYLSDPTEDVRVATEILMADFLREIRGIAISNRQRGDKERRSGDNRSPDSLRDMKSSNRDDHIPSISASPERGGFLLTPDGQVAPNEEEAIFPNHHHSEEIRDGAWSRGQGVTVDHAAIVEILIQQLDATHDEIQQSTALRWIAEFLDFAQDVMLPFTPRLIPAILPNLAVHIAAMQSAAQQANHNLFTVIQSLPSPPSRPRLPRASSSSSVRTIPASPPSTEAQIPAESSRAHEIASGRKSRASTQSGDAVNSELSENIRPHSPNSNGTVQTATSLASRLQPPQPTQQHPHSPILYPEFMPDDIGLSDDADPFDYQATVSGLTIQFISEYDETRVAALKWLIMLHSKAPKKILAIDDGTFFALLKTLSDPSEEVIKYDLQLLAQISSTSEEGYFKAFMINLLKLFSTDLRLLETRGSLIIRQLCLSLNTDRIYRTFAEILEQEEDLEFASTMVQRLNVILITSQELVEFRRRLRNLDSKDGQALFSALYRSWCHNPVAVFSLCLLAQAYEHASNLLPILAEMEITVQLLVQIDKLVQLLESPVFTYLRLQLLEPEKFPFLFKCLYGLLMLLPQSSAFISLRNRLNAVSSLGFVHAIPRATQPSTTSTIRSKLTGGRDDTIRWPELLSHFRTVQMKHEKARRGESVFTSSDTESVDALPTTPPAPTGSPSLRPVLRRKLTGELSSSSVRVQGTSTSFALSPLNPKRASSVSTGAGPTNGRPASPAPSKQRRALGVVGVRR
ncbi:vacuolar protein 14 C-terminal Fig4p binding-domain-containing protein [Cantharellus anzutake]|uniref:vacuolar protein 14 C-terminal Fig4p binding-domain-containing protein n=1 Tax=Cantharellus anzutake TaxID=1750568 RepID=UPI0019049687|nr:vacuolar protein 14 C-terminal Fig4p binding-domain-containing protein [Cantharellus anzutake]KAF8338758.1 vacuolar protein 14 C-terminal Fig4p binding-domain-containing protein [Cantharellus anzutake]